jgi:5-formyltetrahydrofolate cyclo-ligase
MSRLYRIEDKKKNGYNITMPKDIGESKKRLRRKCKQRRAAMDDAARAEASRAICEHIETWEHFERVDTILTYMPMQGEVDLIPLVTGHPDKRWAIPRIVSEGAMIFHLCDLDNLIPHAYGMMEPAPDCCVIYPDEIELALCPGLAFNFQGCRLGYGGGFYDRFLHDYEGISAGITYQDLLVDAIPCGRYDIPMDYIITETGVHKAD